MKLSRLLWMMILSSVAVAVAGFYIKYYLILPLGLDAYENESVMALPFLYVSDAALQSLLQDEENVHRDDDLQPLVPATQPTFREPKDTSPDYAVPWVEESWFDNTLFIGDSRVEGLKMFARLGEADYFCDVGLQVYTVLERELEDRNFPKQTLESLLKSKVYDHIIINFGLNEAGYPEQSFRGKLIALLNVISEIQPDSKLILHGILSVTEQKSQSAPYLSLSNLQSRNGIISSLTEDENWVYVDANPWFTDENGYLLESITNDGYHPTVTGYRHWRDWFRFMASQLGISH